MLPWLFLGVVLTGVLLQGFEAVLLLAIHIYVGVEKLLCLLSYVQHVCWRHPVITG